MARPVFVLRLARLQFPDFLLFEYDCDDFDKGRGEVRHEAIIIGRYVTLPTLATCGNDSGRGSSTTNTPGFNGAGCGAASRHWGFPVMRRPCILRALQKALCRGPRYQSDQENLLRLQMRGFLQIAMLHLRVSKKTVRLRHGLLRQSRHSPCPAQEGDLGRAPRMQMHRGTGTLSRGCRQVNWRYVMAIFGNRSSKRTGFFIDTGAH